MVKRTTDTLMESYLRDLIAGGDFTRWLAEDATLTIVGTDQAAAGRGAIEQMIRHLHEQAFEATVETKTVFASGSHAALEADFVGRHIAEFAGVPATNRSFRVPYSAVYDVADGEIAAVRLYMCIPALIAQITAPAASEEV